MTRKLEELFDLAPTEQEIDTALPALATNRETLQALNEAIDKVDSALPAVRGLEATDTEMDELAGLATGSYKDLMDLGMNIDPRFAGVIMQTAGTMLGHAITAKTAKMDKKLRMINLQLAKARLDHQIEKDAKKGDVDTDEPIEGRGMILDRNELLKQILDQSKSEKK